MAYSMVAGYATARSSKNVEDMMLRILLLLALGVATASPAGAAGPRDREQDAARRATQEGRFLPLRAIEARILPRMQGFHYLGPELDWAAGRYRLKFMRGARVIWIDIDARTGEVVGRSGF